MEFRITDHAIHVWYIYMQHVCLVTLKLPGDPNSVVVVVVLVLVLVAVISVYHAEMKFSDSRKGEKGQLHP